MISTFFLMITLLLFGVFWYQSAKVHELAVARAKAFCSEHDLQLLDDTVTLKKIRIAKNESWRRCIQRIYQMEYFNSAIQVRQIVYVTMNGKQCHKIGLNDQGNNVINLSDYR